MKKKCLLSGISAKIALLTLAISGALMTGCYKDDGLDANSPGGNGNPLEDAVYTITGTVTDVETGDNIAGVVSYNDVDGAQKSDNFNGSYSIKIAEFDKEKGSPKIEMSFKANDEKYNGGQPITRTVTLQWIENGNAVVYPVDVVMKKSATPMKERKYNLSFVYKNAVSGEAITSDIKPEVTANGVAITEFSQLSAGDYIIKTPAIAKEFKSSITVLSLPYVESEDGAIINKVVEILISPVDPDKEDTYTTLAGVIVDENGTPLLADKIELFKNGTVVTEKTIANSTTNFVFTINDKENGEYTIKATVGTSSVVSGIYSIPGCGNQNITIVAKRPVVPTYVRPYKLAYVYKNALTGEAINKETEGISSTPEAGTQLPGEYAITTTTTKNNFKSNVTHITLEEVKSTKENDYINKTIVIALTPADSKETVTTLSGTIIDDNGNAVMAEKIELFKKDKSTAEQTIKNSASFSFSIITINDEEGTYTIKTTLKPGTESTSGDYNVPSCGNQVITVVFEKDKPAELKDVVYNLTFKAINIETLAEISSAEFSFNGDNAKTATNVKPGVYELHAKAEDYYNGKVNVELPAMKNESGIIDKTIAVYLTKEPVKEDEPTKVVLMGEVVDNLGNMIMAQSITLNNPNTAVYNTNHFSFEVEVPANKARNSNLKQWLITAKVSKVDSKGEPLKPAEASMPFVYDPAKGITAINKNISIPYTANKDGIIVIDETEPGDGEQGQVIPDVNPETGEVKANIETVMNGNGTPEDKTTIVIEEGTIIETAEGTPLISPIILTRDAKEEKEPTGNISAEVSQPTVLRSFYGNPDGAQFIGNPLKVTFADPYAGELGALQLEYKVNGIWGADLGAKEVATDGNDYTMLVSHFSQFRAAIVGTLDDGTSGEDEYGNPYSKDVNQQNNTDKQRDLEITFKNAPTGTIYQSLEEAIAQAFTNENAQKIVKSTIANIFASRGMAIKDEFDQKDQELTFSVAPYTFVKSITIKTVYKVTTYKFILNGKTVEVVVKSVEKHDIKAETYPIGHGHGHGHGDDLNAGGGIVVSE